MPRRAALVLTAYLVACLEAPTAPELRLESDPAAHFDVVLAWMPPVQGDVSGYAVDVRLVPGEFAEVQLLDADTLSWHGVYGVRLPDAPELSPFEFRVRALSDDDGARASNVVSHRRGLRQPRLWCGTWCTPGDGRLTLEIESASVAAEALVLERRVVACGWMSHGPWTPIQLPPDTTSYVDDVAAIWLDGVTVEYRIAAASGPDRSVATSRRTTPAPLLAPSLVAAAALAGGVQIAFRNESACADAIVVGRQPRDTSGRYAWAVAVQPAPALGAAGTVTDPAPPAGTLAYDVYASRPGTGSSAAVTASVTWPPPAPFAPAVSP